MVFFIAGSIRMDVSSSAYPKLVSKHVIVLSTPQPRISVKIKLLPDYQYLALCLYQLKEAMVQGDVEVGV
jgi:hypothetical protein